ncbi:hypothetical protein Daura_22745 [Dactylosporangium aurantiacum]|uniref:Uncharacterized protein n=1 Tax=Dactylosporangium aurantiacum TaxID=35754 RepID=A0A9Q9ML99_9ACTN|nr:hypothetical protein [Dactylosporangium aurantiacum]MDG6107671.1 hypothetical protein [Dactylosporangium aurantiacum]UWZ58735.1 hypothetical protein Daura_22745 [Dactylosporangium aurantiacum]
MDEMAYAERPAPPLRQCEYQPAPGSGSPPPCWLRTASARQRMELALGTLRRYGVRTVPAHGDSVAAARQQIEQAAHQRYPGELVSYLFWTATADRAAFAADGSLQADLTVHYSTDATVAVKAALTIAGLEHRPGPDPQSVTIVASTGADDERRRSELDPASCPS